MGSTRLPGKSMLDMCGAPLVGRILERVKRVKCIDEIVLATSTKGENDILEKLADQYGIFSFRGSEDDLVGRYYFAAKLHKADIILRLPADNTCSEPGEFDRLIDFHLNSNFDFTSNICNFMENGYPDGIGVEAFDYDALEYVFFNEKKSDNREHVALNFYNYIEDKKPQLSTFSIGTIKCPQEFSRPDISLDVNTLEDYRFMLELYGDLYPNNPYFGIIDIINWYDNIWEKAP